eukprot:gene32258-3041_t
MAALAAPNAWHPRDLPQCIAQVGIVLALFVAYTAVFVRVLPYHAMLTNVVSILIGAVESAVSLCILVHLVRTGGSPAAVGGAKTLICVVVALLFVKALIDLVNIGWENIKPPAASLIASQTPSIVPNGGEFVGEVPGGVKVLGWHRPTPSDAAGLRCSVPLKYDEHIGLAKEGLWFISAVAVTEGQTDSFIENATFRIAAGDKVMVEISSGGEGCGCAESPSNPQGGIVPVGLTWHIHTLDSPHPDVFVCYSSDAGGTWALMPQAAAGDGGEEKHSFPLLAAGEGAGMCVVAGGAEAFDAPFDWQDHHRRRWASRSLVTREMRDRMKEVSQSRGVMTGAGLLLFGGALAPG